MESSNPSSGRTKRAAAAALAGALATTSAAGFTAATAAEAQPQATFAAQSATGAPPTALPSSVARLETYDQKALDAGRAKSKKAAKRAAKKLGSSWAAARGPVVDAGGAQLAASYDQHVSKLKTLVSRTSPSWGGVKKEAKAGLALDAQLKALFGP